MKSSDLFVKALENEGVQYVFGIPGEENLDLLDSLSRSDSITLILTRHEQAPGFMAATYGRLTGKAGVCLSTLGPGATNFVTAAYAQLGGMPMLMITGQKPVKSSKQGQFQVVDIVDMMRPLTKYTRQLVSGANIPSRIREAFRVAQEEKPGAVHLELPEDIAREEVDEPLLSASLVRRPTAEAKSIAAAVFRLEQARRPVLVVGAAANRKQTSRMLRRLVSSFGIPFVTTQMGKGVLDERDLVRAELQGVRTQHRAARQCAGHHGRRAAFGHRGQDRASPASGDGNLWRRWLYDEFPGAGNRGPPRAEPCRGDLARRRLRHDQMEAGQYGASRLRARLRQP